MNENMEIKHAKLSVWLPVLMDCALASLVNSVISYFPFIPASLTTWISRGIMLAVIVCMFQLASANGRYKTAAILRTIWLSTLLLGTLLHIPTVLVLGTSIISIIAVYQEYHGHSEVLAEKDTVLSTKWRSLFIWSFIAPFLLSIGSSVAMVISSFMKLDVAKVTAITTGIMQIPQYVIDVIYLMYLKKMLSIFEVDEVQ